MCSSVDNCPKSQVTHPVCVLQLQKLISFSDRNSSISPLISELTPPSWQHDQVATYIYTGIPGE